MARRRRLRTLVAPKPPSLRFSHFPLPPVQIPCKIDDGRTIHMHVVRLSFRMLQITYPHVDPDHDKSQVIAVTYNIDKGTFKGRGSQTYGDYILQVINAYKATIGL